MLGIEKGPSKCMHTHREQSLDGGTSKDPWSRWELSCLSFPARAGRVGKCVAGIIPVCRWEVAVVACWEKPTSKPHGKWI